jgi:Flp pilus assembly protein TadD
VVIAMLRRRRKLLRTGVLAAALLLAVTAGLWYAKREARYVPGERSDGLIDTLARRLPADRPRLEFADVSRTAGIDFDHAPFARTNQLPEDMGSGVALGDFDGDGWCDAFLLNTSGPLAGLESGFTDSSATAHLYRNRGDGSFEDVTERAGVGLKALGQGAAWVDVDSDGDLDLFVSTFGTCRLWRNDWKSEGRFTDVSASSGVAARSGFWTSIAAGDYDRDGRVDLFVCGYVQYDGKRAGADVRARQYDAAIPVRLNPSAFRPEVKLLFHNESAAAAAVASAADAAVGIGGIRFEEVAATAGVTNPTGRGLGVTFADLDADGWPDLYVANDVSDNALFINQKNGTFRECGAEALIADYRGAMGLAIGDFDDDLDLDIYITHWIAQENALYVNITNEMVAPPKPGEAPSPAEKPSLAFMDRADEFGLGQTTLDVVGWATGFCDLDNDGRRDLFSVNGHTIPLANDPVQLQPQKSQLFWNAGGERGYFDLGPVAGDFFTTPSVARGGALFDYDQDGDEDLLILRRGGKAALLRNDGGNARPGVRLRLRQPTGNTLAIGAVVRMTAGGRTVMAQSETQGSYLSQHAAGELAFGLNDARQVDSFEVTWPDGVVEKAGPFPADSIVSWTRGTPPTAAPLPGKRAAAPRTVADQKRFFGLLDQASELRIAGDFAGAAALYRTLLEIHPDHEDSLYYLGNCLVELGREKEALAQFERLAQVNPRSNRCFMQIGRIRLPGGDPALDSLELAEQAFQRSLAINQEESGPLVQLGVVALLRGDLELADERLRKAAVLNLKSVEARYLRAWVQYRRGDAAAARALLAEAQQLAKGAKPVTALPAVIGEGDTKKGGALLAEAAGKAASPFERWKTLAQREVDVDSEFREAPAK